MQLPSALMPTALALLSLGLPRLLAFKVQPSLDAGIAQLPWQEARAKAVATLRELNPIEKSVLLRGSMSYQPGWYVGNTLPVPRLSLPALTMQDAGNGFRPVGIPNYGSVVQWPCALALSASWDEDLVESVATAMGKEFKGKGSNVMLGPAINVHRVSQNGRNWEYLSGEDPYLGARLVRRYVRGVQSQGVMAVAKHFAFNEQETNRGGDATHAASNSEVDARTAWELYYPPFEAAVQEGIGAFMCSYNKVNGTYACENEGLLKRDLKGRMGFQGFVMSDWGATHSTRAVSAGLDQDMPGGNDPFFGSEELFADYKAAADEACLRILSAMYHMRLDQQTFCTPPVCRQDIASGQRTEEHLQLARKAATQSVILLKNQGNVLPFSGQKIKRLAVIGAAAIATPPVDVTGIMPDYYSGGGSGHVPVQRVSTILSGLQERAREEGIQLRYSMLEGPKGWKEAANWSDAVLVVGATTATEGVDRPHLMLDHDVDKIVAAISKIKPTALFAVTPGVIVMPWRDDLDAIAMTFLPGEQAGQAASAVLFGRVNPQGRLPIQLPATAGDVIRPQTEGSTVSYSEGLFTSYRSKTFKAAFPFGHGLSYTQFHYNTPSILKTGCEGLHCIRMKVKNVGSVSGTDTPQAYVHFLPEANEPVRVLRGFQKTRELQPLESEVVTFVFSQRDLSVFDPVTSSWVPQKNVEVHIGASSADISWVLLLGHTVEAPPQPSVTTAPPKATMQVPAAAVSPLQQRPTAAATAAPKQQRAAGAQPPGAAVPHREPNGTAKSLERALSMNVPVANASNTSRRAMAVKAPQKWSLLPHKQSMPWKREASSGPFFWPFTWPAPKQQPAAKHKPLHS